MLYQLYIDVFLKNMQIMIYLLNLIVYLLLIIILIQLQLSHIYIILVTNILGDFENIPFALKRYLMKRTFGAYIIFYTNIYLE